MKLVIDELLKTLKLKCTKNSKISMEKNNPTIFSRNSFYKILDAR